MAVRNQHVRQSSRYIYKDINGVRYQFSGEAFVDKTRVRNVANKVASGKLAIDTTLTGVIVAQDGSIRQVKLS